MTPLSPSHGRARRDVRHSPDHCSAPRSGRPALDDDDAAAAARAARRGDGHGRGTDDGAPDRNLDANQATGCSCSRGCPTRCTRRSPHRPPTSLPVARLGVSTRFQGRNIPITVFHTSDPTTVWVGMPPQDFDGLRSVGALDRGSPEHAGHGRISGQAPAGAPHSPEPTTTTTTVPRSTARRARPCRGFCSAARWSSPLAASPLGGCARPADEQRSRPDRDDRPAGRTNLRGVVGRIRHIS